MKFFPSAALLCFVSASVLAAKPGSDPSSPQEPANSIKTDYPEAARRENREGDTKIKVLVGIDGRIKECWVTSSSGSPDLDAAACNIMRENGRFKPAKDKAGKPTEAYFETVMKWRLN